jgi:8-oxo-dGTP diphosphatase
MYTFKDLNGYRVDLYFKQNTYIIEPRHILAIIKKGNRFLCTIHRKRGVEFPGGKVEQNETLEQAVKREVLEETGVEVQDILPLGYYVVHDEPLFSKAIFYGEECAVVHDIFELETTGRIWLTEEEIFEQPLLSFYMKDEGMQRILQEVKQLEQRRNL